VRDTAVIHNQASLRPCIRQRGIILVILIARITTINIVLVRIVRIIFEIR
jgi:hypothetical protein